VTSLISKNIWATNAPPAAIRARSVPSEINVELTHLFGRMQVCVNAKCNILLHFRPVFRGRMQLLQFTTLKYYQSFNGVAYPVISRYPRPPGTVTAPSQ
jgi:hypothetical protein